MQKMMIASRVKLADGEPEETAVPMGTICQLIYCLSGAFQIRPQAYEPENGRELWVSFPQAVIQCDAFFEEYGDCLASLCRRRPVSVCGYADGQPEEGELLVSVSEEGRGGAQTDCVKRSISGRDFSFLSEVWLRIRFERCMEVKFVSQVVSYLDSCQAAVGVCARWADVFHEEGLFEETDAGYFKYVFFREPEDREISLISCLTVPQLAELWRVWMDEMADTLEFELFYEHLGQLPPAVRSRLTMGLRLALERADIRVENCGEEFRVTDSAGARLWFDFRSGSAAEKLFLKLLFPAVPVSAPAPDAASALSPVFADRPGCGLSQRGARRPCGKGRERNKSAM